MCFCAREIFSSKKINKLEIVLITSIYYTTNVKKTLNIKFHSMPVYDEKYIKAKVD